LKQPFSDGGSIPIIVSPRVLILQFTNSSTNHSLREAIIRWSMPLSMVEATNPYSKQITKDLEPPLIH
jgi:hypothetical protein